MCENTSALEGPGSLRIASETRMNNEDGNNRRLLKNYPYEDSYVTEQLKEDRSNHYRKMQEVIWGFK